MKRIVLMVLVLLMALTAFTAQAGDRSAAASQLRITADHTFWANDDHTLSAYGAGNFLLNLNNGYANLQGYMGARVSADKLSIYLLGVSLNDYAGWSAGPSLWVQYNGGRNYFFTQYDYNCPFMSTMHEENPALMGDDPPLPPHSYYMYSEYMYKLKDNTGIGYALENSGTYETSIPMELAYGPFFQMGILRLWAYYDVTPQLDGYELWGLRFQIKIF